MKSLCVYTIGSSPSGAKKSSKSKKVCFAAGTAPGSVEGEAATSKASTSKKEEEGEGGDETDGEETDEEEESTQPFEEGKEKAGGTEKGIKDEDGGEGSTTTPALKEAETGAGSAMDIDEGDPTVAYDLETDEENTEAEDSAGGGKEERKTEAKVEGAAGGAEPTLPYNLKEEDEEDSDKTDVEQEESKPVPETSKAAKKSEPDSASASSKKEGTAAKVPTAGEHSEEVEDTEKVESSATEPESQEVKEKREFFYK